MISSRLFAPVTLAFLFGALDASAQCVVHELEKFAPPATLGPGDQLGIDVSLSADVALLGAWADDDQGSNAGAAYVYRRIGGTFTEEAKLVAGDGVANDAFGFSVAVSGSVAVVSARLQDAAGTDAGAVYVLRYVGGAWLPDAKLVAGDAAAGDQFGYSVAIDGDVLVVGATRDDDGASNAGSAYVFRFDGIGWAQEAKLVASSPGFNDFFGWSVAVDGDVAIVGAVNADTATVFRRTAGVWGTEQVLTASDATGFDRFGYDVDVDGARAVVGAALASKAYVFDFGGASWSESAILVASDGLSSDAFGTSVALDGADMVVGARLDDDAGTSAGASYLFHLDGGVWGERVKQTASDAAAGDEFATAVALDAGRIVVGAPLDDAAGGDFGGVHAFEAGWLGLDVSPRIVGAGTTVTVSSCAGVPGRLAGLFVVEVQKGPTFVQLPLIVPYSATGDWSFSAPVTQNLGPVELGLRVYSTDATGAVVASNTVRVEFP